MSRKSSASPVVPQPAYQPDDGNMTGEHPLSPVEPVRDNWWWSTRLVLKRIDQLLAEAGGGGNNPSI
ncbi:MAG: hypothetical protein CVV05_01020 [Gammaproteobacteria bacterium HGW-Gammaproteobacteria-1]|jgi:hypothetical protein|nr:MAG: hypothetical protein CVV05_01020 [Gammaproteobacteria bacterium HGW-Gammaproteobacteria-1]